MICSFLDRDVLARYFIIARIIPRALELSQTWLGLKIADNKTYSVGKLVSHIFMTINSNRYVSCPNADGAVKIRHK
jgi:hypothetical protein